MTPRDTPSPAVRRSIHRKLLRWYDRNARDLPWRRRTADPYAQWVAEIMLQQTQVQTVIPYYERFMRRFPDLRSLAAATDDELLSHWQGLGYYRRAANLHKAAKLLTADGRDIPDSADALRTLPGIGRYTAGAIASIAFGERAPAVDGNVARVFARLFNIREDIATSATVRRLWSLADCLLPARRCGDFNQALMELGAVVCTPASPRCDDCPLGNSCKARAINTQSSLPVKRRSPAVPEVPHVVILAARNGAYLVTKRPPNGLWGGLWEFPNTQYRSKRNRPASISRLLADHDLPSNANAICKGTVTHRLTHRLMHFDTYHCIVECGTQRRGTRWVRANRLSALPMSTACRKMIALAQI